MTSPSDAPGMKVLLVHNRYRSSSPSGEDRVVDQEAAALRAADHTVQLFERHSDDIASRTPLSRVLVAGEVLWSSDSRRLLLEHLRRFRPDVVHVHNTFPLLSPSVLSACRAERVPVVVTLHNYRLLCPSGDLFRDGSVCHECVGRPPLPALRHGCYRGSPLATLPLAVGVVAHRRTWRSSVSAYVFLSNAQRDAFAGYGLPTGRVFVKPNLVPTGATVASEPEDFVMFAGRLTAAKGVELLMEAWDQFQAAPSSPLRLIVAGSGPLEDRVNAWAAARPSVECVGILGRDECSRLLSRARAAVIPSLWEETFGLVAVEAMAAGVPPVAPAHGSFPDIVTHGDDGVLFPPGQASALASIFDEISAEPHRFRALGKAAQATHTRRFSPGPNIEQLVGIYRFAIDNPVVAGSL